MLNLYMEAKRKHLFGGNTTQFESDSNVNSKVSYRMSTAKGHDALLKIEKRLFFVRQDERQFINRSLFNKHDVKFSIYRC